ncbi:MAG: GNAT family N-acetyltransferase [Candidatus Marinimicrobia bacterium]|jgi:ribosomal protein S18 acetylase RimI-like enzyme|nr:GNAT family N-acetyltransferase [Candidatus Neomarinimicrobiota bacterium]MDP6610938.1 GNAT family N-acetyltransferase [Candidatus Neomarinimicrobiota bacterium]|tara:strand:+ start:49 stop:528 length:480 start_codon:yes stop_codon:yes gene_type:complete
MSITIEKVSYDRPKDARILEVVLTEWFKDPKDLNLTSPNMPYPFSFKKWVSMTYANQEIESFVIKSDDWIVGLGNLMFLTDSKRAHAFHIFVDKSYRRQGLAKKMMHYLETLAKEENMETMSLRVMPKNKPAIILYEKLGFKMLGPSKWGDMMMVKKLV